MELNAREAQRLVDLVAQAPDVQAAVAAAQTALTFLIGQLHLLGDLSNGYPRNSIDGAVWQEGYDLTEACDRFADAVSRWHQRRGEEQATRLAVAMAMQVLGHYPNEIFPRVLRNAKCCEALAMTAEAVESFLCIVGDFEAMQLQELLDPGEPLDGSQLTILTSLSEALAGLQRLSQDGLTEQQRALQERVGAALERST